VTYARLIGNLKPDLSAELVDGSQMIWDLTTKERPDHVLKTMLYQSVVAEAGRQSGRQSLIYIGEYHWSQLRE